MMQEQLVLEPLLTRTVRRRALLPLWIKIFCWLFMIAGAFTPITFIAGLYFQMPYQAEILGLKSYDPFSVVNFIILGLFLLKGIAAFGLWAEKDWGIIVAVVDAIISIAVCCIVMLVLPALQIAPFTLRLELALLIPYLLKLQSIKPMWKRVY